RAQAAARQAARGARSRRGARGGPERRAPRGRPAPDRAAPHRPARGRRGRRSGGTVAAPARSRLRAPGVSIGRFPVGQWNAITDVGGVRVGHTTLIEGEGPLEVGKGPVRTGVTAVVPNTDIFGQRTVAGGFVLNGAGEVSGLTQVQEWGLLETPILL